MSTPVKPIDERASKPVGAGRAWGAGPPTTRTLSAVLSVLLVAALGLIFLLWSLLRPAATVGPGTVSGYPIQVVRSIYGYGTQPDQMLKTPLAAVFDPSGNVWISDTGNSRVLVFTQDGALMRTIGADEGPGQLFTPYGIAVDRARDRVYVADWTARAVPIYSTSGAYVGQLPADDQNLAVFGPDGFTPYDVHILNGRVVVSSNDGLYFFDEKGRVAHRWGGEVRGVELGMFNFPDSFAFDETGDRVYVADTLNRRVVALDSDGRWLWVSGVPDARDKIRGFWQLPRAIRVGADGNIYVVDTFRFDKDGVGTGHVVVLSPEGDLVSEFGRAGSQEDAFDFPEKFDVTPGGLFALADRQNNRVVLFRLGPLPDPDEMEAQTYRRSFSRPHGVSSGRE